MTLEETIETLTKEQKDHHSYPSDIIGKAELLGIEALKIVKKWREEHRDLGFLLLPGETKE